MKSQYYSLEGSLYKHSWGVVGQVSTVVESGFTAFGIKNRQKFFLIRGAYPFYLMSSLFLLSFFHFYMDEDFKSQWSTIYHSTFILKFVLTFVLAYVDPAHFQRDPNVEEYIKECRMDLQKNVCPADKWFACFRVFHCQSCKTCTMRYEKHSYLVNKCISANNLPLYWLHIVVEVINASIICFAMCLTFNDNIESELIFFCLYLIVMIGHFGLYIKKFIIHTRSMVTGESLFENENRHRLHYKQDKILSMM